jgi:hypothetical protein
MAHAANRVFVFWQKRIKIGYLPPQDDWADDTFQGSATMR